MYYRAAAAGRDLQQYYCYNLRRGQHDTLFVYNQNVVQRLLLIFTVFLFIAFMSCVAVYVGYSGCDMSTGIYTNIWMLFGYG